MSIPPSNDEMYVLFLRAFKEFDVESISICSDKIRNNIRQKQHKLIKDDAVDEEDLYQVACLKITDSLDTFDGRSKFSTWLYRIILNIIVDHNRRVTSQKRTQVDDSQLMTKQHSLQDVEYRELINTILRILEKDFDRRMVVIFLMAKIYESKTQKEIATIVGLSEGQVSKELTRALTHLKAHEHIRIYGYQVGILDDPDIDFPTDSQT